MKNKSQHFMKSLLSLAVAFSILLSFLPGNALAYTNASSKIRIITQHQERYKSMYVPGHKTLSLWDGGCGLFTIAHAMQWLSNKKLTDAEEYDLMK